MIVIMALSETFFLMLLPTIVAIIGLKMWYSYKINERYKSKYKGALTELGKLKSKLSKSMTPPIGQDASPDGGFDFNSMTLEQAMEAMGFDAKELENPIVRPIAEKIFDRLKQGNTENSPTDDMGY